VQTLKDEKRQKILDAASGLFAARPFHKVLLSDVAVEAAVGKGTLYTYFESKEDLYLAVLYASFEKLIDQVKRRLEADEARCPLEGLEIIVRETVHYAYQNPHLFKLMRSVPASAASFAQWDQKRRELTGLIESVIRRGVRGGQFSDPHPELTARFVPGLIRSALLEGVVGYDQEVLASHILRFLYGALLSGESPRRPARGPFLCLPAFSDEQGWERGRARGADRAKNCQRKDL
jgi:AcrR family transcriptional regulator